MIRVIITTVMVLGFVVQGWGQENLQLDTLYDSSLKSNAKFDLLNYEISQSHRILKYHDPILYLSVAPSFRAIANRITALEDQEGQNGYWLEGDMNYRFDLYKGAHYSPKGMRPLRVTFDAGFTVRMTRDTSSPLLPTNNRFGIGIDYMFSYLRSDEKKAISPIDYWLTVVAHHYSNGQSDNHFFHKEGLRNNYIDGDFSTNYLRLLWYTSYKNKGSSLYSGGFGYQRDGGIGNPFVMTDSMKNGHYGQNRLLLNLQWLRSPSFIVTKNQCDCMTFTKAWQWMIRSEMSYILDNDLQGVNGTDYKFPFSMSNYLTVYPWEKTRFGFLFKHFFGRDYLNMRYDDVVNSWMVGMTIDMNRY